MSLRTRIPSARMLLSLLVLTLTLPTVACGDDDGGITPPVTFSREQALQACVAADACGVLSFGFAGSYCLETGWDQRFITATAPIYASIYECVLEAVPDCQAVENCFGGGLPLPTCSDITDGYCDGNVRVECDTVHQTLIRNDCGLANQSCTMAEATMTDLVPKCGLGSCIEGQHVAACQDFVLLSCAGGNWEVTDCSVMGLTCGDGPTGRKECIGPGASCADDFEAVCDGDILRDCVGRHRRDLDCAALAGNYTCSTANFSCIPAGTDCIPGDPELCQGATIRICVDGSWQALDCGDLGFTSCTVTSAGAHCVP